MSKDSKSMSYFFKKINLMDFEDGCVVKELTDCLGWSEDLGI